MDRSKSKQYRQKSGQTLQEKVVTSKLRHRLVRACTRRLPASFTMKTAGYCVLLLGALALCNAQQRVAPGVPPQQYQDPMQHVPQHIPQQQMHMQQVPQMQLTLPKRNSMHIQEHMEVPIDTSKMTDQELQFHYFKMHDADNNNKLDGCELIKSLIHWHEQGHKEQPSAQHAHPPPQEKIFKDDELIALIDPIMNMDDADGDGFIDYPEFVRAQNKAAAAGANAPRS
ncbi:Multiple coagulation factor deficiency protein 2-like protein [Frankliniella fusca]|uniref:Multiple coagulation factor deficiency protein 2-like protein n=1 Tax=Frankliniella fusca TaxID=407009 RepID=A0AAE1HT06_9NEOP|nr:Multiple coagulation factor deficiency protein 2-like protein [Frankliniella fusca]